MADDTTNSAAQQQDLTATAEAADHASVALNFYKDVSNKVSDTLKNLNEKLTAVKTTMDDNQDITNNQVHAFGLLSVAALGVRKSFDNLGEGIDSSGLSTFTSQIQNLGDIIEDSPLYKLKLGEALRKGLEGSDAAKAAKDAVFQFAESADNALRLQNAYIQLAAKTGNLNAVYDAAGPSLENINILLGQQQKMVTDSSTATGVSAAVVEQYYAQLGSLPKALEANVKGTSAMGGSVSMLTATMQLATGSGRKVVDVVNDMKEAFRNYNITGEEALRFSARMTEISNKFGIELDDVRGVLTSTSEAFKIFGNEAEGAASIYNDYLGAIQKTGVSGHVAVDVVKGMVGQIKDLTIAQKAFLSAQTGGPGGLLGGFQIEKELRDGKIDKVFDRVRQSLGKQFGQIVTLEEASQSQAAAAQLTKQIMLLRQGPLGQFASSDQSAIRILEGFRNRDEGKVTTKSLTDDIVQKQMDKGNDINEKSYTELTRIRSLIESTRGQANVSSLGFTETNFAAGTGEAGALPDTDSANKMRQGLADTMGKATIEGAKTSTEYATALATKTIAQKSGEYAYQLTQDYSKFFSDLGPALKAPVDNIRRMLSEGKGDDAASAYKSYLSELDRQNEEAKKSVGADKKNRLEQISKDRELIKSAYGYLSANEGATTPAARTPGATSPLDISAIDLSGLTTPASRLGTAARGVASTPAQARAGAGADLTVPAHTVAHAPGNLGEITVHVEGYCINCRTEIDGKRQRYTVNPSSK